jgi:hypothetical protein
VVLDLHVGRCGGDGVKADEAPLFRCHAANNAELAVSARHKKPITDDLVVTCRQSYSERPILLSRAQVGELHDWFGKWLAEGWDGVPHTEGPTTADVIRHFQDVAVRARVELDHARSDHYVQEQALLALLPAERRSADLAKVAAWQSEQWARIEATSVELENFRLTFVGFVHTLEEAGTRADPAKVLAAMQKMLRRFNHPTPKLPDPVPDAPVFTPDVEQLSLFEGATP